jgi:hypothetical protein
MTSTFGAWAWNGQPVCPSAGSPIRDISPRESLSNSTSISSNGLKPRPPGFSDSAIVSVVFVTLLPFAFAATCVRACFVLSLAMMTMLLCSD